MKLIACSFKQSCNDSIKLNLHESEPICQFILDKTKDGNCILLSRKDICYLIEKTNLVSLEEKIVFESFCNLIESKKTSVLELSFDELDEYHYFKEEYSFSSDHKNICFSFAKDEEVYVIKCNQYFE